MPYVSDQQRKFMHAKHPKIAKRWDAHTPKGEKLPKYVDKKEEKSAAFELGKAAGVFDTIGRSVIAPAMRGGANLLSKGLGAVGATRASTAAGKYAGGLDDSLRRAAMSDTDITGKVDSARKAMAAASGKDSLSGAQNFRLGGVQKGLEGMRTDAGNRINTIGMAGTAAVGIPALMGVSRLIGNSRRKREEEAMTSGGKQASTQLGTPITDGILAYCAQQGFTDEQTALILEKGAEVEGGLGDECREFIDRLSKA